MAIASYRNLIVWQRAMQLVVAVYTLTAQFSKAERFGLTNQMRRAAVAIPSNIAEGKYRWSKKEYQHYLRIAFASGAELETQIAIAKQTQPLEPGAYKKADTLLDEVMKMLRTILIHLGK